MAKTTKTQFEPFLDGQVDLWTLNELRQPVRIQSGIRFQERVVGSVRYYEAELAGHQVERVIRIPRLIGMDLRLDGCFAVIGSQQYQIARTQVIPDTLPPCIDLTLEQASMLLNFDSSQPGAGGRF